MPDIIVESVGFVAKLLGGLTRLVWEGFKLIVCSVLELLDHVLSWVEEVFVTMADKFAEGWHAFVVEIEAHEIPPSVISPEKLRGAKKVSLSVLTDKYRNPQRVDRAVAHERMSEECEELFGDKTVIEIER